MMQNASAASGPMSDAQPTTTPEGASPEELAAVDFEPIARDDAERPERLLLEQIAETRSTLILAVCAVAKSKTELVQTVTALGTPRPGESDDDAFERVTELPEAFHAAEDLFLSIARLFGSARARMLVATACTVVEPAL